MRITEFFTKCSLTVCMFGLVTSVASAQDPVGVARLGGSKKAPAADVKQVSYSPPKQACADDSCTATVTPLISSSSVGCGEGDCSPAAATGAGTTGGGLGSTLFGGAGRAGGRMFGGSAPAAGSRAAGGSGLMAGMSAAASQASARSAARRQANYQAGYERRVKALTRRTENRALASTFWTRSSSAYQARNARLSQHLFGWLVPSGHSGMGSPPFGKYETIYAQDPNHFDQRDGGVYGAQGYGTNVTVPLAPNVRHAYNYGWGMPSSRITNISNVAPYTMTRPLHW